MDIVRLRDGLTLVRADLPSDEDAEARKIRMLLRDTAGHSGWYGAWEPRDWRIEPARPSWWTRAAQRFLAIWRWRVTQ